MADDAGIIQQFFQGNPSEGDFKENPEGGAQMTIAEEAHGGSGWIGRSFRENGVWYDVHIHYTPSDDRFWVNLYHPPAHVNIPVNQATYAKIRNLFGDIVRSEVNERLAYHSPPDQVADIPLTVKPKYSRKQLGQAKKWLIKLGFDHVPASKDTWEGEIDAAHQAKFSEMSKDAKEKVQAYIEQFAGIALSARDAIYGDEMDMFAFKDVYKSVGFQDEDSSYENVNYWNGEHMDYGRSGYGLNGYNEYYGYHDDLVLYLGAIFLLCMFVCCIAFISGAIFGAFGYGQYVTIRKKNENKTEYNPV